MVATPIGNLADISLRAIHVLSLADAVACEDTRHSGALLRHLGLDKPLLAAHEHNEREAAQALLPRLARGERVAYVSDAGTPGISDPGATLVAVVREAGHPVVPIPGASSAVAAMSVAGDVHASGFRFVGFLPTRSAARSAALAAVEAAAQAQVVFEAPHRIDVLAQDLSSRLGDRPLTICRELTKQFESVVTLTAAQWPAWLAASEQHRRGEFVVVVHSRVSEPALDDAGQHDAMLQVLMDALPLKQAVAITAKLTGAPRNALYSRALGLKDGAAPR